MRSYNFSLISYLSEDDIKVVLRMHCRQIKHYAYIYHNKEDNENHYHIILVLNTNYDDKTVRNWFYFFPGCNNTLIQPTIDLAVFTQYLTHSDIKSINDESKADYDVKDIVSDNIDFFLKYQNTSQGVDRSIDILNDILSNLDFFSLAKKYGRDVVINYHKYKDYADLIFYQNKNTFVSSDSGEVVKLKPCEMILGDDELPF